MAPYPSTLENLLLPGAQGVAKTALLIDEG